ncbi:hypothetical protein DKG77_11295 [Flagellimonas aquimarina]|uniref:CAAX prenyl protease 2/Lysostaphin resistance protein A-like domain-containing protein n=1 Tax=Flagellimonas aquimarina TaxID=2201895 RepID=A0A316L1K4_9FLAO|nr:type II CAAX endopeptidase family protein [Allomuricauda koreensis]PWL38819.1 hypothetical protein DKG77_11295 [Allomuricauda koreensis]
MNFRISFLFLFFIAFSSISQEIPGFGDVDSHDFYVNQLNDSKDVDFQRIIELYDAYIIENPLDLIAKVERCKFIGNSYYDEYEEYNLKYEETEKCIDELYLNYPNNPNVLIYKAENLYGDEKLAILEEAQNKILNSPASWTDIDKASINKMLGDYYRYGENSEKTLRYYVKAQGLNSDLDLSIPIAEIYVENGKNHLAKKVLLPQLDNDTVLWQINTKAKLLLEVGETELALKLFDEVKRKDSTFINYSEMALAMENLGDFDLAREFLVKGTLSEWNKVSSLQNLFDHDLKHSDSKTALSSLRNLQEENSFDDFFAIKRFHVFFKNPFLPWSFSELLHLSFLVLSIFFLVAIPYLWVLPIFNLGLFIKRKGKQIIPKLNFNWGLRHFWIISFVYLFAQYLLSLVFFYEENINAFFEVIISYEEVVEDQLVLANSMLAFVAFMAIGTLFVLKKDVLYSLYSSKLSVWTSLKLGIGFVIFNIIFLKILKGFVDIDDFDSTQLVFNASVEIVAILKTYGFFVAVLAVAVVAPIYEEVIFRGVVLGSVEKHLGFIGANVIQASMFALIHFSLKLFIYYFVFGLVTGYYARKTEGLITGIILHAVNNFIVIVLISLFLI